MISVDGGVDVLLVVSPKALICTVSGILVMSWGVRGEEMFASSMG